MCWYILLAVTGIGPYKGCANEVFECCSFEMYDIHLLRVFSKLVL